LRENSTSIHSFFTLAKLAESDIPFAFGQLGISVNADDSQQRIEQFRLKIKDLSDEELIALSVLMKRGTLELTEEMLVLQERIIERRVAMRKRSS
jgi:hypothetical protein